MQVTEKLTKALTETKYLNADNVGRYRCIMRIFFENYEKLHYWLYQEEIYDQMKADPFFADYRLEQCQQDLAMLVEWKNLNTIQDTRKVASIEEFKNKKYRYQMSEYSVEIERLVMRLENLFVEGASLEPTLLERIRRNVDRFEEMSKKDTDTVYIWWNDLNNDFIRLNQNYKDYMRDLNSVKAEELMHTREFLVFKDRLVEYLRSFIKGIQQNVGVIEETLRTLKLSLRWKSKTAEKEEQLDTNELVGLLKRDAHLLNPEDFEKLSKHFRSKVEQARRNANDSAGVSFYQVMKDTLDYRKWFEFQLFSQKNNERRKELTNSVFGTFSGGEKAMSMYVPLFSAVVAKYQGGRSDAPRLISLDEAFAGVDSRNIRDMFRLMSEFEFDFIINSQVLWGDSNTLDALAIYQLIRPENAKFVSVMPYLWNGYVKKLLENEEEVELEGAELTATRE